MRESGGRDGKSIERRERKRGGGDKSEIIEYK